jgi:predicted transcriptional regulator
MNYGDTVSIQCIMTGGDLPVQISWKWNNKSIENVNSLSDVQIDQRGKKVSTLFIESVTSNHIGMYTCIAINKAGTYEQSSLLRINGLYRVMVYFFLHSKLYFIPIPSVKG